MADTLVIRRSEPEDCTGAASLFERAAFDFFPDQLDSEPRVQAIQIAQVLEVEVLFKSLLCCTVLFDGKIVGFAAFNDSPRGPHFTNAKSCIDHVLSLGHTQGLQVENNIFLTAWASQGDLSDQVFELVMKTLFNTLPDVDFVLCLCQDSAKDSTSTFLQKQEFFQVDSDPGARLIILSCPRIKYRPNLHPRVAQVEDYDDLVKIFDAQSQVLTQVYGEYFLAELVECQDEENKALVLEHENHAVGLLCLSTDVDVDLLQRSFDLSSFNEDSGESKECEYGVNRDSLFAVTLFCIDMQHKSRTKDVLEAAFDMFPDRTYCALTLPNEVSECGLLSYFFSVPVVEGSSFSHSLYLVHRDSLRAIKASYMMEEPSYPTEGKQEEPNSISKWVGGTQLEVAHLSNEEHFNDVYDFLQGVETVETIVEDIRASMQPDATMHTLLVQILGQTVGVVIAQCTNEQEQEQHELDRMFDLRSVSGMPLEGPGRDCKMRHGTLCHILLNPIFNQFSRSILRDSMRELGLDVLNYKLQPRTNPPVYVLQEMTPVRPRRVFHLQRLHRKRHLDQPIPENTRYALFTLTKPSISEPRLTINTRIVIVGASETGLSILEQLLFIPHLYFSKLTLLAPGGIPDERFQGVRHLCTQGTSAAGSYDSRLLDRLGLRDRVCIVDDRMTYLERDAQAVVLQDETLLQYDYLVIATGLQDTTLQRVCKLTPEQLANGKGICETVYGVNGDPRLATLMRRTIQQSHANSKDMCIVYGDTLEAYSTIAGLIEWGKSPELITLVKPPKQHAGPGPFHDDLWVLEKMEYTLQQMGVKTIENFTLQKLTFRNGSGKLAKVVFHEQEAPDSSSKLASRITPATVHGQHVVDELSSTNAKNLRDHVQTKLDGEGKTHEETVIVHDLECSLFISAAEKSIDPDIFASINDTGLVYDGRMVVNSSFQSVDPRVFGAGQHTKFSRRYRFKKTLENFNSYEVGAAVAGSLLNHVDPVRKIAVDPNAQPCTFSMPKIQVRSVELPGQISYFRAVVPGWDGTKKHKVLSTGSENSYCKLVVDHFGRIVGVSYALATEYFIPSNGETKTPENNRARSLKSRVPPLDQLVGIHVSYLNDVERHVETGIISDLFQFLSQDWAAALYHDRFSEFCRFIQVLLTNPDSQDEVISKVVDSLREAYKSPDKDDVALATTQNELIGPGGCELHGLGKRTIQSQLMSFVAEHTNILEMYYLGE